MFCQLEVIKPERTMVWEYIVEESENVIGILIAEESSKESNERKDNISMLIRTISAFATVIIAFCG